MRILPGVLKELLKHVPTVLFEVTDWNELASELPKLSKRLVQKDGYSELFSVQLNYLEPFGITLTSDNHPNLGKDHSKAVCEKILMLYFAQLFSPHGIFLDLRASHFEEKPNELLWNPPGLWVKFDLDFREGLLEIYRGFYHEDDELYHRGLVKAGLMSLDWPEEDRKKLAGLFKAQFGDSITSEIQFTLEGFKGSMLKIADFLLEKKVKMSKDFLYLGIYLVTMYSLLEKSSDSLAVRRIYLDVEKKATA